MYPPATGCSYSEAFSMEPFHKWIIEDFDGFNSSSNTYEHLKPEMNDSFPQPNINQPIILQQNQ